MLGTKVAIKEGS